MPKSRRTVLSGIVTPFVADAPSPSPSPLPAIEPRRRSATKEATIQQTLYLPPTVHDQLRELAFTERVKMHALILEGLDSVFRKRGLRSIANLMGKG
jgi:hypothetical protein